MPWYRTMSFPRIFMMLLASAACMLLVGGCVYAGFAAAVLDPPKVEALYVPPQTPMLILVENRENPEMSVVQSDEIISYIMDDLVAYKVCPLVDRKKFEQLRDRNEKDLSKMTISEIGKAVGADQVLYVDVKRSSVGGIEGVPVHGRIDIAMRVVDVKTGNTMFPKPMVGEHQMSFETSMTSGGTDQVEMRRALAASAGTGVGRVLHTFYPEGR